MTVVAALLIEGIPAIIGDFLITDNATRKPHIFLPTRPDINSPAFAHLNRRVADFVRKIHIFNSGFVAGFSGPVKVGEQIFSYLEARFPTRAPSLSELDDAFQRFNTAKAASVTGWTRRSRPRCFLWSAAPGAHVEKVDSAIIGSGAAHFSKLLTRAQASGYSDSVTSAWDRAALFALSKIGALVGEELSSGSNLADSYGYGGEIIMLTSQGFRAANKLLLLFWDVRIEVNGEIKYSPASVAAAYENRGRYTAVQVSRVEYSSEHLAERHTTVRAITPIHDKLEGLDVGEIGRLEMNAPYRFLEFRVFDVKSGGRGIASITDMKDEASPIRYEKKDGVDYFEVDRSTIDPMIANLFERKT